MAEKTGPQINGFRGDVLLSDPKSEVRTIARPYKTQPNQIKLSLTYDEVRELRLHPTVKLARKLVLAPAIQAGWSAKAKDDVPEEIRQAVEDLFVPMHSHIMSKAILGNMDFGFCPFEKVWRYNRQTKRRELYKLKPLLQPLTDILINSDGSYAGLLNKVAPPLPPADQVKNLEGVRLDVEETLLLYQDVDGTDWYGQSDLLT